MLIAPSIRGEFIADLQEELNIQISASLKVINVNGLTPASLLEQLRSERDQVLLMYGFEKWHEKQFASLDVNRSRMETGSLLIFSVDFKTAGNFLDNAPNLRSYFGANIFTVGPDPSWMSPQQIDDRLNDLRSEYHLSDSEVVSRAIHGDLSPEPHLLEWLVLLGRGDLVR